MLDIPLGDDRDYFDGVSSCLERHSSCETCSEAGKSACLTGPWSAVDADFQCVCDSACKTCANTDLNNWKTCYDGNYFDGVSSYLSCP